MGSEQDARTYHSTSLLLPDGRVISAGDDRDIAPADHRRNVAAARQPDHQIYNPPYLFDGRRPDGHLRARRGCATTRPSASRCEGDPGTVTRRYLMAPGAVTHANDMNQRAITLDLTTQPDGLTLTTPLDATVAPPGYYMLFVQNADGAVLDRLVDPHRPDAPDAPALPVGDPVAPAAGRLRPRRRRAGAEGHHPGPLGAGGRRRHPPRGHPGDRQRDPAEGPRGPPGGHRAAHRPVGLRPRHCEPAEERPPQPGDRAGRGAAPGRAGHDRDQGRPLIQLRLRVLPTATAGAGIGRYRSARIGAAALRDRR